MAELTAKDLADFALVEAVGRFVADATEGATGPKAESTRRYLAEMLAAELGGDCDAWMNQLRLISGPRDVVVSVSGGVVQDVEVPPGVTVEVRDYDNAKGLHKDDLNKEGTVKDEKSEHYGWEYGVDDDGQIYQKAVYEGKP